MTGIGISEEKANKYVLNLRNNLTPDDVAGVTEKDIPKYAMVCANNIIKASSKKEEVAATPEVHFDESVLLDERPVEKNDAAPAKTEQHPIRKPHPTVHSESEGLVYGNKVTEDSTPDEDITPETEKLYHKPTRGGRAKFIGITAVTSPLWIIAFAIFFAPFVIMFAAEIALIVAMICLLAGCTALGTAASLTGIVYGIVKMFSTPAIGLYEIGFGVIIAGVSMICGILIYNGAVRFMPWLIRKSARLFKFTFSKIKPILTEYKRRCEKL